MIMTGDMIMTEEEYQAWLHSPSKHWAIDLAVYHAQSGLSDAVLEGITELFKTALTANGNEAEVYLEDCYLSIFADAKGDNRTFYYLLRFCEFCDCWIEVPDYDEDGEMHLMTSEEDEKLCTLCGID